MGAGARRACGGGAAGRAARRARRVRRARRTRRRAKACAWRAGASATAPNRERRAAIARSLISAAAYIFLVPSEITSHTSPYHTYIKVMKSIFFLLSLY